MWQAWILLLVLHTLDTTVAATNSKILYVSPCPTEIPCPAKPCHSLSYYAHNRDLYLNAPDVTFKFLPGRHDLDVELKATNMSSVSLLGDSLSAPGLSTTVNCINNSAVMIAISGVYRVYISALEVSSCGENLSVSFVEVDYLILASVHVLHSKTVSIYNSTALIENTMFANNTGTGCGGSLRIENSNVTLKGSNDFVSSFTNGSGGGMCAIGSVLFNEGNLTLSLNAANLDGGGMYSDSNCIVDFDGTVVVSDNSAEGSGGGIAAFSDIVFNGSAVLANNFCHAKGSAIYSNGSVIFANVLFQNNSAGFIVPCMTTSVAGGCLQVTSVVNVANTFQIAGDGTIIENGVNLPSCDCIVSVYGQTLLSGSLIMKKNCGGICIYNSIAEVGGHCTFSSNKGK